MFIITYIFNVLILNEEQLKSATNSNKESTE